MDPFKACIVHWIKWNELCKKAKNRLLVRIEDVDDARIIENLLCFIQRQEHFERLVESVKNMDHRYNTRKPKRIDPVKIAKEGESLGLHDASSQYGYNLNSL